MKAVIPAETFGKWIRDLLINSSLKKLCIK